MSLWCLDHKTRCLPAKHGPSNSICYIHYVSSLETVGQVAKSRSFAVSDPHGRMTLLTVTTSQRLAQHWLSSTPCQLYNSLEALEVFQRDFNSILPVAYSKHFIE